MFKLSIILMLSACTFLAAEEKEVTAVSRAHAAHPHAAERARAHRDLNHQAAYPYRNPATGVPGTTTAPQTTVPTTTIQSANPPTHSSTPTERAINQSKSLPANQVRQN